MSFLSLTEVFKKYPSQNFQAINDVSWSMTEGETIAIVGENGSGKTTLLKLISGLEDTDKGEVLFKGNKITGPSFNLVPGHQQIKMLYQEFNLLPKHSIRENIVYNLGKFNEDYQEKRIAELVTLCRLEDMEYKLPAELSGGQQQRVALAKAIADDPTLLLMDEPFSNLDIMLKDEIKKDVIRALRENGKSVIFVTHDTRDALSLSDKILVMRNGKILQFDTPRNVYEKPADEYVAYLFGNVNILKGKDFFKVFPQASQNKKLSSVNSESKICIRPEHIAICKEEKGMFKGKVKHVAYLGDSYELELEVNKQILRVNTRKKKISKEDTLFFKVSLSRVHAIN